MRMSKQFCDNFDFEPSVLKRTPEGYLTGMIRISSIGVFPYYDEEGKIVQRLRPQVSVGDEKSVLSANNKPVTLRHPSEDVTPDNIDSLTVGFIGGKAYFDGLDLWNEITITHRRAIDEIERGDVESVSMGYSAILKKESGNWRGSYYDEIMEDIQYNHVALVKAGRAGDGMKFRIGDSAEIILTQKQKTKDKSMKKLLIDGVVYDCDEAVAKRVADLEAQVSDAAEKHTKEIEKVTAERDTALAEVAELKKNQKDEAEIARLADEKIQLIATAKECGCEVKATDSVVDIKKAVIKKAYGETFVVDGKSDDYIAAAFDTAVVKAKDSSTQTHTNPLDGDFTRVGDTADELEKAYKAADEEANNLWKGGK